MAWKDYSALVLSSIRVRKLRTGLSLLGIIIGISAVVSLLSLGIGMQQSIANQFKQLGTNRVMIAPGGEFLGPGTSDLVSTILDASDLQIIRNVRGVESAQGVLTKTLAVEFDNQLTFQTIFAFDTNVQATAFVESVGLFDIEQGRELKSTDKYKAVLGNHVAEEHLNIDKSAHVGDKIKINGIEFDVIGIQKLIGTGVHDIIIRIPQDTLRTFIDEHEKYSLIFALSSEGFDSEQVAQEIKRNLRNHRNVKEDEEDFNVQTATQTISQLNTILLSVQLILIGITAISLFVGGIGIMNTMYTSVLERTKEIGIMKSIGAKNSAIVILFLLEAGLIGVSGGLIGIVLGIAIAKFGEYFAIEFGASFFRAHVSVALVLGTLCFSTILGMASGTLPARQASRLKPVDALRSYR